MNVPTQIGNYKLERIIGRGGSSEVWLARHTFLSDHVVAVKVLMTQDRDMIRRFQREASIAARLRHLNIVQLYDYGYHQPFFFALLEYIQGSSLREVLDRRKRLPLAEALTIFSQVAAALDYAHGLSVVHRDVAPANILVEEASRRVMLTDFGIARDPGQPITVARSIMGTPGYLSPEHARSATTVTHLSDIFSLGVVLYQMLSGELPWGDEASLADSSILKAPPLLKERGVEGVPSDVDRVLATLLAPDPTLRYPTAGAAVEDLRRIVSRHEIETQNVSPRGGGVAVSHVELQSSGIEPNEVERLLTVDLVRPIIERTHRRADELRNPETVAALLDAWAAQSRLRKPMLGRLARLHKVASRNVYFYRLQVLFEQRTVPEDAEEPDRTAQVFPLEPELDLWAVPLPAVEAFSNQAGGRVHLPGSTRVTACSTCSGNGATVCPNCRGRQRVYVTRTVPVPAVAVPPARPGAEPVTTTPASGRRAPASASGSSTAPPPPIPPPQTRTEQVLVPCPECEGRGGVRCERCEGVGRLVRRKAFRWSRTAELLTAQDDLPALNEDWLARTCKAEQVYAERQVGGLRPEWSLVGPVAELVRTAESRLNNTTRVALSELSIAIIPVTDIVFDLGKSGEDDLYKLAIYGFENLIPPDWRFFNWERVVFICSTIFLVIVVAVLGAFAIMG